MDFSKINLQDNQELARLIIQKACKENFKNRSAFEKFRNCFIKKYKAQIFHNLYFIKAYNDLLKEGKIKQNSQILSFIQKRGVRTQSGVAPVTVMTKPFPCPGRCVYCPTDVRMPKSYLPSQPAAQRAFRQQFNPYTQVFVRLKALHMTGHEVSKVELRIIGGTWSAYRKNYQMWFLKQCLLAMNEFYSHLESGGEGKIKSQKVISEYGVDDINTLFIKPLKKGKKKFLDLVEKNETAKVRCIGINIETRPDFINEKEICRLRYLGVTKVEIGVQTTDDKVQKLTKRGHDLKCVRTATKLLKNAGFKISYHMMPNLPGSTVELDKKMIGELFQKQDYQPDYLKIYPCMVVPKSELFNIYKRGEYQSYNDKTLIEILYENLKSVPYWCRIDRIARDIPAPDITAGTKTSNIRQILEQKMEKDVFFCKDIRSREIKNEKVNIKNVKLITREYKASGGREIFISFEDLTKGKLVALLRLRILDGEISKKHFIKELKNACLIREIHVYGKQLAIGKKQKDISQHIGWGSKLMKEAEKITLKNGYKKIAVIAGIGVRDYYRKKGYKLEGTYMIRNL